LLIDRRTFAADRRTLVNRQERASLQQTGVDLSINRRTLATNRHCQVNRKAQIAGEDFFLDKRRTTEQKGADLFGNSQTQTCYWRHRLVNSQA
jgi:hypothetical protein